MVPQMVATTSTPVKNEQFLGGAGALANNQERLASSKIRNSLSKLREVGGAVLHDSPRVAFSATTCQQFTTQIESLREVLGCKANRWEFAYHYTQPELLPLIPEMGLCMSTQGQSDGGMYFFTFGPATYKLETKMHGDNIITDCSGPELLDKYKGKGMLNLCLVYGAEAVVLCQGPGGRDNTKAVTKTMSQDFSLRSGDGNYFLRPNCILGVFVFPAPWQPGRYVEAQAETATERAADSATKERLGAIQRNMAAFGDELRVLHTKLHKKTDDGNGAAHEATDPRTEVTGAGSSSDRVLLEIV